MGSDPSSSVTGAVPGVTSNAKDPFAIPDTETTMHWMPVGTWLSVALAVPTGPECSLSASLAPQPMAVVSADRAMIEWSVCGVRRPGFELIRRLVDAGIVAVTMRLRVELFLIVAEFEIALPQTDDPKMGLARRRRDGLSCRP